MSEVVEDLCIKHGEDWVEALMEDLVRRGSGSDSRAACGMKLREEMSNGKQSGSSTKVDGSIGGQDGYAAQFGIKFIRKRFGANTDSDTDPVVTEVNCTSSIASSQKELLLKTTTSRSHTNSPFSDPRFKPDTLTHSEELAWPVFQFLVTSGQGVRRFYWFQVLAEAFEEDF